MNKRRFLFIFVYLLFLLPFIAVSIFLSIEKDKNALKDKGFISIEERIDDYEYFWDFIYNGYPFTEVCERLKVGLKRIKDQEYKNMLDLEKRIDYYIFYSRLCSRITDGKDIGHLYPSDYFDYENAFKKISLSSLYLEQLPIIDDFYNSMPKTGAFTDKSDMLYADNLKNINPPLMGTRKYSKPYIKIINTDYIAYIQINSFYITDNNEKQEYRKTVDKFFMETADYKHIIIDIRNNGGGSSSNYEVLITPNLKANKAVFRYSLYNENKYTLPVLNYYLKNDPSTVELIEKSEVPDIENCGTIKNDKAIKIKNVLASKPIFGYKPCEDKKFWLLVSSDSYSAADRFTDVCKKIGFATVVGKRTGGAGVNGYYPVYIVLPNSGLLIKFDFMYGLTEDGYCADEFGTAPDIYNLPGKDALETCLETIKKLGERTNF